MITRVIPALLLIALAAVIAGCNSPLTKANDRIGRCITIQTQAYGERHTQKEYDTACRKWEAAGELKSDGEWEKDPRNKTT